MRWGATRVSARAGRERAELAAVAIGIAVVVGFLVVVQPGLVGLLAVLLLAPALAAIGPDRSARTWHIALTLGSLVTAMSYIGWRLQVTSWSTWWLAVPLLVAELFGILHALGFAYTVWPRTPLETRPTTDASRMPIFVMVPTVNEGVTILRQTLLAVRDARREFEVAHPHALVRIVVCNDGRVAGFERWRDVEELCDALEVECITREIGGGAKAGNIEHARRELGVHGDCLLVIFDADQQPAPDFLIKTVPPLGDPEVAWVQTGQYYGNLDNPVAKWADEQQAIFYQLLMPGKSTQNAAFICGTNVVLRAAALDEIGGFAQDSVTEDFVTSLELHGRWKGVFVEGRLAVGLGPLDLPSYLKQQHRWALGTLGALRTHGWRLLTHRNGMSAQQRIQYLQASTHYLGGLKDSIFVVAPLAFLVTGIPAVEGVTFQDFLWQFLPYFLISQTLFWTVAAGKCTWRGLLIGFGSFPVLIGSLISAVTGRRVGFAVTAKTAAGTIGFRHLVPHLVGLLLVTAVVAYALAAGNVGAAQSVSIVWAVYSGVSFAGILWLGVRDRAEYRIAPRAARRAATPIARRRTRLVVLPGVGVGCALLVAAALQVSPPPPAQAFDAAGPQSGLLVGVALPGAGMAADSPASGPLGVIGRTQVLADHFDESWARSLAQEGTIPWLTLLLDDGAPSPESSLVSLANGTHDEALRRWAASLRTFGSPIYLTMLPQVDGDWVVTSAIAGGGIPQDVAPAWRRVRDILAEEKATNVALVWSPADPASDHRFAPPPDEIDAVLLSIFRYPGHEWRDLEAAVGAVERRYPATPIILEVSATGEPDEKAPWLGEVGRVAREHDSVRVLVYHDSGPEGEDAGAWSVASDPRSRSVFESLMGDADTDAVASVTEPGPFG